MLRRKNEEQYSPTELSVANTNTAVPIDTTTCSGLTPPKAKATHSSGDEVNSNNNRNSNEETNLPHHICHTVSRLVSRPGSVRCSFSMVTDPALKTGAS